MNYSVDAMLNIPQPDLFVEIKVKVIYTVTVSYTVCENK